MNDKKTILQINTCNFGSTGKIMLNIHSLAKKNGYTSFVAYENSRSNKKRKVDNSILISNMFERNYHWQMSYYSGMNGCFSRLGTKIFLKKVSKIKPDIIHIHNLHNSFINIEMLFNYFKKTSIPIVWTLHDCYAITGKCLFFSVVNCDKWKTGCYNCPQYKEYPGTLIDRTKKLYNLKKKWFTGLKNVVVVTPSKWLADITQQSYLSEYPIKVINNGIDLNIFKPTKSDFILKYHLQNKKVILGVAYPWSKWKGLDIFKQLSKSLDDSYIIVLVGLHKNIIKTLPKNIIGIKKTSNQIELAKIYTTADIFLNPSYAETFGMVTIEALACGTPVIVSNKTAIPEVVSNECGVVVEEYNVKNFYDAIINFSNIYTEKACVKYASSYEINIRFQNYYKLYDKLYMQSKRKCDTYE